MSSKLPKERKYLSREEFAATYGADDNYLKKDSRHSLTSMISQLWKSVKLSTVVLSGTISDLSKAFGGYMTNYEHPEGAFRGRTGSIYVPEDIADHLYREFLDLITEDKLGLTLADSNQRILLRGSATTKDTPLLRLPSFIEFPQRCEWN